MEIYVNGFSTSLPEDIQFEALTKIPGFEKAKMFRPGYAIEYDFFPPTQLKMSLETHLIQNLYFAGQINGTTGYEEAACQGLMAGINAHNKVFEKEPLILKRSEAYIGVLIDDLVNKGTQEPYRMFTSRAEYRILLRQDNADLRLTEIGHGIGLADDTRYQNVLNKKENIKNLLAKLNKTKLEPDEANPKLEAHNTATLREKTPSINLLRRPDITIAELKNISPDAAEVLNSFSQEEQEQAEIHIKYESYIEREQKAGRKDRIA